MKAIPEKISNPCGIHLTVSCTILAALCMVGEVLMDLIQPTMMSRIIDEGVLGSTNSGISDMDLIWSPGLRMILTAIAGAGRIFIELDEKNENMGGIAIVLQDTVLLPYVKA